MNKLTDTHRAELKKAVLLLEGSSIAAKMTNIIGKPLEKGLELLPSDWKENIDEITKTALTKACNASISTMDDTPHEKSSNWWHKLSAAVSGAAGGLFGFAALAIELPISTTIMMRSIVDIARSEGESINNEETKQACLLVFALGGSPKLGREPNEDSAVKDQNPHAIAPNPPLISNYFSVVNSVVGCVAPHSFDNPDPKVMEKGGSPAFTLLISRIAERFAIQIAEKVAAQSIPLLGAAGGAIINTIFIDSYQDLALGHFTVRRLENIYGKDVVEAEYMEILKDLKVNEWKKNLHVIH